MSQARSARPAPRPVPSRATSEAAAAAVPALRLVDRSAPRRRALTRVATVLAATLAGVGLFGVVSLHVLLAQGQAGLDALHSRSDAATVRHGRLTVDVAQLESPERVVARARLLGMVPLAAVVYVPAADPASPLPPVAETPVRAPVRATTGATATPTPPTTAAPATATASARAPAPATTVARPQGPSATTATTRKP